MRTPASCRIGLPILVLFFYAVTPGAKGQPWHSADAIPIFRGTETQAHAHQKWSDSWRCGVNLRNLWSAARVYAHDHASLLPEQWSDFTNEIARASALYSLYCPADLWHPIPVSGAQVDLTAVSYEILAPGARVSAPEQSFIRCPVHGNTVSTHGVLVVARPYEERRFPLPVPGRLGLPTPADLTRQEQSLSAQCCENLLALGLAARLFAIDNADVFPSSFPEIADVLDSLRTLVCPSDLLRATAASPAELNASTLTYHLDAPGANSDTDPRQRLITCPIHDHHVDMDGAVATGTNRYPPRLIIGHPLSCTVEPGRSVELAVLVGDPGLGPFRYQWRRQQPFDAAGDPFTNTVVLADATNRTYRIPTAGTSDEGYYDVVVHDGQGGYQLSHLAYVRVEPVTNANSQWEWEAVACYNNLAQIRSAADLFTSAHSGQRAQSYRDLAPYLGWPLTVYCPSDPNRTAPNAWETVDFAALSYTLETGLPVEPGTNVLATCKVHHYWVRSDGAVRLGETPPAISTHPSPQITFAGRLVSLGVEAIGDRQSYQWFKNDGMIIGETNSTLTLPSLAVTNTASYFAIVTNPWGSATSHVAVVTVNPIPAPQLQWAVTSPGVEFALGLSGPAGVECRLEASPDLNSWTTLTTSVLREGVFLFLQRTDALPAVRFYRATLR